MALQLFKIADVTVATPQSSIEFTSIPQGYTDLAIYQSARSTDNTTGTQLRFNGTSTGVATRALESNGATVYSYTTTDALSALAVPNNATASTFGNALIYIPNYTSSNNKSVSIDAVTENNATTAYPFLSAYLWSNTAAITSITISANTASFATNSTFTLYGIL